MIRGALYLSWQRIGEVAGCGRLSLTEINITVFKYLNRDYLPAITRTTAYRSEVIGKYGNEQKIRTNYFKQTETNKHT